MAQTSVEGQENGSGRPTSWSESETELLQKLWLRKLQTNDIAKVLRRSPSAVSVRASRLGLPPRWPKDDEGMEPEAIARKRKARTRPCMICRTSFHSEGSHNRICNTCKESDDWKHGASYTITTW